MRIVVWNCNMGLHKKLGPLLELAPDITIVPECAKLDILAEKAPQFQPATRAWIGDNPNKGLGIFTFGAYSSIAVGGYPGDIPYFMPLRINGPMSFNMIAVWAHFDRPNSYVNKVGPLKRAIDAYREFIENAPAIVAGDFNDNVQWFKPRKADNHSQNVGELAELGLRSAYHLSRDIPHGDEPDPTIYWRDRKKDGPRYHIDYCFIPKEWERSEIAVTIGDFDDWVGKGLSDHVPLIVDIEAKRSLRVTSAE